jgi:hypothetical protein
VAAVAEEWALTPLVQNSGIGEDGARALAEALQVNGSVTELHIGVRRQLHWTGGASR